MTALQWALGVCACLRASWLLFKCVSVCVCAFVHVLRFVPWHDAIVYLGLFLCVESSWRDTSSTC